MKNSDTFVATIRQGIKARTDTLVVHVLPNTDHATRVGFIVSKKVGNAVIRNRVKRKLRHLVRPNLKTIMPANYVIRALPKAAAKQRELASDLTSAFDRCTSKMQLSK